MTAEKRPRRKLTRQQQRERAEYMRRYRSERGRPEDRAAPDQVAAPAPVTAAESGPPQSPTSQPAAPAPAPAGMTMAEKERLLAEAIAGTVEAVADTVQLVALDAAAPHLGTDRAKTLGALWAPILAPLIDENTAKWLPLALAVGGTANAAYGWAHEYRQYRAAHPKQPKKPLAVVRGSDAAS